MAQSYYDILGVPRGAVDKDVRAAYRKLARKYHPDVNPGSASAEATFKKINEAYEVLSDPITRKDYDEFGENWKHADELRRAGAGGRVGSAPEGFEFFSARRGGPAARDIFEMFNFGGQGFGNGASQPEEIETEITLDEAYRGTTRLIALTLGRGQTRRLEVKVPPGIGDGGRVRIHPDDGPELQLIVRVRPDPRFRRDGADLYVEASVPLLDAVLGGQVEVPTMTGRVALTVPSGTQNGRSFRLAGKGMPKLGTSSACGDLYATVRVVLPESFTEEERVLFEKMRQIKKRKVPGTGSARR